MASAGSRSALSRPEPDERPWRSQLLVAGSVLALSLLGEPFVLLGGALGGGLLLLETAARERPRPAWRTALPFLWPVALGLVLALPALLAYLDYAPHSVRGAGFTHEGVTLWSAHPAAFVDIALPGVYGEPALQSFDGATGYWARALVADKGYPLFAGTYVGGLVLALAVIGAATGRGRWLLPTWLGLLALLALGRFGPFTWLYGMPGLDALRYPVKWLVPALLPLALLAGRGVDRVERTAVPTGRAPLAIALGVTILVIAGVSMVVQLPAALDALAGEAIAERAPVRAAVLRATLRGLVPSIVALTLVYFALVRPAPSPRAARHRAQWTAALLALLVGVDLVQANARLAPTVGPGFYRDVPALADAIVEDRPPVQRIAVARPRGVNFVRDPIYAEQARGQREALVGYTALAYGLDLAFGPDTEALHPLRYTQLQVMVASAPPRERLMLLGAAGVTHLVTYERLDHPQATLVAELPERSDPPLRVWRNGLALPRARVVAQLVCHDGAEGLIAALTTAPDDLFQRAALVDQEDRTRAGLGDDVCAPAPAETGTPPFAATVESVEDRGDSLSVVVSGDGGFLIVSDTWLPGWSATLDGQPVPLIRADYAFRAVALEAGRHEVVLSYDSW